MAARALMGCSWGVIFVYVYPYSLAHVQDQVAIPTNPPIWVSCLFVLHDTIDRRATDGRISQLATSSYSSIHVPPTHSDAPAHRDGQGIMALGWGFPTMGDRPAHVLVAEIERSQLPAYSSLPLDDRQRP
ncbi:hypothetical protein EDC01DRAFT_632439 [Geopyxis carbonaria]|nr:hypothetical protein EDC01DRAFT_632439 [Geopyxis carbonaria]